MHYINHMALIFDKFSIGCFVISLVIENCGYKFSVTTPKVSVRSILKTGYLVIENWFLVIENLPIVNCCYDESLCVKSISKTGNPSHGIFAGVLRFLRISRIERRPKNSFKKDTLG